MESSEVGEPAATGSRQGWKAVAVFTVFFALAYLDRRVISFLVDPIRHSLKISDFQLSLLQGAAFVFFYTVCSLPIGWAVDRFSRRRIIFLGVLTWSVFAAAGGLAKTFPQLLFARLGVGAGEASLHPAANSMLADYFPRGRLTSALSVYGLGGIIGASLAVAIGGLVIDFATRHGALHLGFLGQVEPWQFVFLVTGTPGLLIALLVFLIPEPGRQQAGDTGAHGGTPSRSAADYVWRHKRFYLSHFAGFAIIAMIATGFTAWGPARMMRSFSLPASKVGLIMAGIMLLFGGAGMLLPGRIVDRLTRAGLRDAHLRYFIWGALALGCAGIAFGLAPTAPIAFFALGLVDLCLGYFPVAIAALAVSTPAQYRGQVTAMFLLVYNLIGQGFGPSVIAGLTDFLFHDEKMLGPALALTYVVFAPIAAACFAYGLAGMRRATDAAATH